MPVKCDEYSRVCVIEVQGDLAGENVAQMKKAIDEHVEQRHIVDFVVDLQKSGFLDSHGLESLLWTKRRCESADGEMKLVRLTDSCKKILEMTRLEHRFECHDELATALKTMR